MILSQAFQQSAAREPTHPAIIDAGAVVPYSELRARIGRLSNLYQAEIPHGARVAMVARNGASFAQTFFALTNSGNPVILVNPADTDESITLDLRQLQVKAVLVTSDQATRMQELLRRERLDLKFIEIEKRRAGEYDTTFQSLPDRPLKETDTVLILRDDDAGPHRKYCFFTHTQLIAACTSVKRFYQLRADDRMLTTMHWSHPFALTHGLLLPLLSGAASAVDPETPTVEAFVEYLAAERITRFAGPPRFYFQLLNFCAARKYTLPGVRSITVGMGSISLALRKTYKLLKIPVIRCYGRRESIWSVAMDEVGGALEMESSKSRPVSGVKVAVINEDGEEIAGSGIRTGRLTVMSETVAPGYFHPDPKVVSSGNAERFRGTWLKTDDIARLEGEDDELTVAFLGKRSDMLFADGDYLSPRAIDAAAMLVEGVAEAAGFVRIGKDKKTAFACAVVMKQKKINEKEILAKLSEELAAELQPQTIHFVDSLPRDAFDSVNRLVLQRLFSVG